VIYRGYQLFELEFLKNEANESEGLSDGNIETYRGTPYASCARESGQNSADAPDESGRAVYMTFDLVEVPWRGLSGKEKLVHAIGEGLEDSIEAENEDATDFFQTAKQLVDQPEVTALRIEDFNTKGLIGPCKPGKPFHALVKARGVSDKYSDEAGGSFGIGKFASFSISDLRTVFYSTLYKDDQGDLQFLAQGKTVLVTHRDEDNVGRRATGYWGAEGFEPIGEQNLTPSWLHRNKPGTTIHALGFRRVENWEYRMAASLARNFFVAIHEKNVRFSLNHETIKIDHETLPDIFKNEKVIRAAQESNQSDDFRYAQSLYECLTSNESKEINLEEIQNLGKTRIQILVKDGLQKRLSIIRNGMIITDSLGDFGDKFARFRMCREFVAIVRPDSEGSRLIRKLENPKHDGLSAERITNSEKREAAQEAMRRLAKAIRDAIKDQTMSTPDDVEDINELAEYFPDTDSDPSSSDPGQDEDDPEEYKVVVDRRSEKRKIRKIPDWGGDKPDDDPEWDKGKKKKRKNRRKKIGAHRIVDLEKVRNTLGASKQPNQRRVWFTPPEDETITLSVFACGIQAREEITISKTSAGKLSNGRVEVKVNKGKRIQIDLTLSKKYKGAIELIAINPARH